MKETFMTTNSKNPKKVNPNQKGSSEKQPPKRSSNGGPIKPQGEYPPKEKKNKL
jgi:hypothetical protein